MLDAAGRVIGVVSRGRLAAQGGRPGTLLRARPGRSLRASGRRGEGAKAASETAAQLMSAPPVTISPGAGVADAARLMFERGVKRLPVVDGAGQLVGIVSRIDLVSVFTRPDSQIRGDVLQQVIAGKLALNPAAFGVTVTSGVVTVTGQVERRAVAVELIDAVRHVEGVVGVRDRVSYSPEAPPTAAAHVSRTPLTATSPPGHNRRANPRR
jgi:CBS domain-containing protein